MHLNEEGLLDISTNLLKWYKNRKVLPSSGYSQNLQVISTKKLFEMAWIIEENTRENIYGNTEEVCEKANEKTMETEKINKYRKTQKKKTLKNKLNDPSHSRTVVHIYLNAIESSSLFGVMYPF